MIKKIICWLVALLFLSNCFFLQVSADGGIFGKRYTVFYLKENSQYAVINYVNGKQKMIVSVSFNWENSNKTAWVFPIPSSPENTDIDIVSGAPIFRGRNVIEDAKEEIGDCLGTHLALYTFSILPIIPLTFYVWTSGFMGGGGGGVSVHKTLDKYGLTTRVISSTTGAGIYEYLTENGLEVSTGIIPQLDKYVEKNYSFVVTWIASSNISVRQPGIMIEFPTEKLYYPLTLTSIYGDAVIPTEVFAVGHVSPIIYKEIEPYVHTTYWSGYVSSYGYYAPYSSEIRNFTKTIPGQLEFTKIELKAPSSSFKHDLWIERKAPLKVEYAKSISSLFSDTTSFSTLVVIHLLLSMVAALIAAIFISHSKRENIPIYILIGFGNFVGIFGLLLTSLIVGKYAKIEMSKIALFIVLFFVAYTMLVLATYTLLLLPLQL
ncbi:MAG: hypothetical protein AB1485_01930 [Candidatus Thermoplasmatota archaeon]